MNAGQVVKNIVQHTEDSIDRLITTQGYQSRLEIVGLIKRTAMKPVRYYGKQYPYATAVTDSVLRLNDSYISTTGWRPSTYKLLTPIHDNEFEQISDEFETI